jgi:hypothetical protein
MKNDEVLLTLTDIAVDIQKQMKSIIKLNGAFASGRLYDSIKYKVYKDRSEVYHLEFDYVYYGLFVNYGRKPSNKMPPLNDIREWCRLKGIPQEAAFPIAKKIKEFGYKGINFTKPFETDQAIVKEIMSEMGKKFADDFVEQTLRDVKYFDKSYKIKK